MTFKDPNNAFRFPAEDNGYQARLTRIEARLTRIEARLALLEAFRDKEAVQTKLKEQVAQQQAQRPVDLYSPLRNDTRAVLNLAAFVRRLLDPHDLGWAVSAEVRSLAFEALGLAKK